MSLHIRAAAVADAPAISALIRSVAHYFMLDPAGAGAGQFLQSITPTATAGYIGSADFLYLLGEVGGKLAGVVAVRDNTHLFHLFIAAQFQRAGFASALWECAKASAMAAGNNDGFTVNSSLFAQAVYEHFGFRATGPKVEEHGIAFVPMRLDLNGPCNSCN
jgi:GNAT superfamily N-acetyltransferase